jgi:hypothetical protein
MVRAICERVATKEQEMTMHRVHSLSPSESDRRAALVVGSRRRGRRGIGSCGRRATRPGGHARPPLVANHPLAASWPALGAKPPVGSLTPQNSPRRRRDHRGLPAELASIRARPHLPGTRLWAVGAARGAQRRFMILQRSPMAREPTSAPSTSPPTYEPARMGRPGTGTDTAHAIMRDVGKCHHL